MSTGDLAKQELAEMKAVAGEEDSGKGAFYVFMLWWRFRVVDKVVDLVFRLLFLVRTVFFFFSRS